MQCKLSSCRSTALLVLLFSALMLFTQSAFGATEKKTWQQSDPTAANYLTNRRALVGSGCMVNRIGTDGVKVVPVINNLQNLTDEDLTNTTTIVEAVSADVAAGPLVSVRDINNHYAAGTKAGFMVTSSESTLLGLDLGKAFAIMFYLEGKLQETVPVESGQDASALGLSLVKVGTNESCKEYVATSTKDFDEIRLTMIGGLSLNAAADIGLKYAFVGKANEYTLTKNTENGISKYASDYNRGSMSVKGRLTQISSWTINAGGNLIDDNIDNYVVSLTADVAAVPSDNKEAFTAGTQVGFKYSGFSLLNLADNVSITLYDRNGTKVESHEISFELLKLLNYGSGKISVTAEKDFSEAFLVMPGVKLGITNIYYGFVQMQPDTTFSHHCDINASASLNVCDCDNQYQLNHNSEVPVTWTIKEKPANSQVSVDANGLITELDEPGKYVFTATSTLDNTCTEDVTINYGAANFPVNSSNEIRLVNTKGQAAEYEATTGSSFGVTIGGKMNNLGALVTPSLRDYAYGNTGVSLAEDNAVAGVKKINGSLKFDTDKKVGFVVSTQTTGLNADLINLFNIRLYKDGKQVENKLTANNGVLKAGAAGTDKAVKTAYSVTVPAGTEFDEVVLYTSGVLKLDLSKINVYYAFVSDNTGNPETSGTVISYNNTGASIDAANTNMWAVANVANTPYNLTNMVDDSLTTAAVMPAVSVGYGAKIGVKLGKTINHEKQSVAMVTSNNAVILDAELIKIFKIDLYQNGKKVGSNEEGTDWDVLGANVVGFSNNKRYIKITSPVDYDEIVLTYGNGATVAEAMNIYGFLLQSDYNGDGINDDVDPAPCAQELVLDETKDLNKSHNYKNATMIFKRSFNAGKWNSVILPVNMTKDQFTEAFGDEAKLSAIDGVETTTENVNGTPTAVTTLKFKPVTDETNGTFVVKNMPYLIFIPADDADKHLSTDVYESIEDGTVTGPYYLVQGDGSTSGVSFSTEDNGTAAHEAASSSTSLVYKGSYNSAQAVNPGWYVFSKGNLYLLKNANKQKAYRCWIEYTPTESEAQVLYGFGFNNGNTSFIKTVIEGETAADGKIYNLQGQRVNMAKNGVFIIGGKKVVK